MNWPKIIICGRSLQNPFYQVVNICHSLHLWQDSTIRLIDSFYEKQVKLANPLAIKVVMKACSSTVWPIQLKPKSITTINKSMTMTLLLFVWKSTFIYLHNMWTTCILHQQLGQQWSPLSGDFGLSVNYEPMDLTIVCLKCLSTYCWAYLVDARTKEKCRGVRAS